MINMASTEFAFRMADAMAFTIAFTLPLLIETGYRIVVEYYRYHTM